MMNCIPEASKSCYELVSHGCKKGVVATANTKRLQTCALLSAGEGQHSTNEQKMTYHTFTQMACITTEQFMLCVVDVTL